MLDERTRNGHKMGAGNGVGSVSLCVCLCVCRRGKGGGCGNKKSLIQWFRVSQRMIRQEEDEDKRRASGVGADRWRCAQIDVGR